MCARCKPAYFQGLREGFWQVREPHATFGLRAAAKLVDGIAMYALQMGVQVVVVLLGAAKPNDEWAAVVTALALFLVVLAQGAYHTFFVGRFGATPGKMLVKLRVVRRDGDRLGYSQALVRYLAEWVTQLTCGLGYLTAAVDKDHRALHDHLANTRVVRS